MLNEEEQEVNKEALKFKSKNKSSDVIIDIESTTTMEQTRMTSRRSQQVTRRCLKRSMSISIAVLQRRHVRLSFQEITGSDMDLETISLIPNEFNNTVRIQRANTSSDIVTDLGEIAVLLRNVDRITTTNVSKKTEQAILSKYKKRAVASTLLRDVAPDTSRSQVNVVGGSNIHIGPAFVAVNQTVVNKEVIKGRILGLEVQSRKPKKWKEVRCGVVVFVCFSIILACGLIHQIIKYGSFGNRPVERLDLGIMEWWYISRNEWQAREATKMTALNLPVQRVVIGHSETDFCLEKDICIKNVQEMQKRHQDGRLWVDIGPNFLISGNGLIFEGRGANLQGSMIKNYNHLSITVMFLGDYEKDQTCPEQFNHLELLISRLVNQGVLSRNYNIFGYCQIDPPAINPGPNVMDMLSHMDHWHNGQADDKHCVRR